MKKFSTLALLLSLCIPGFAANEMGSAKGQCSILSNAPDKHVVVKGDTLWGISEMFLEHPWCWPEVWGKNREEIKNPDWIYPGQVILLDRASGRLRIGKQIIGSRKKSNAYPDDANTVKLSPQIRAENLDSDAITSIPANVIEPFLSQPLVLDVPELANAPRIVSGQPGHVNIGRTEAAYVMGDLQGNTIFQVYRPGVQLINPDDGKVLGYEYAYVGRLKLTRAAKAPGEANKFIATDVKEELTVGDRLIPIPVVEPNNYAPHPPAKDVRGRIVAISGGVAQAGQNQTISINLGTKDGLDIGTVLKLYRLGKTISDRTQEKSTVKLPDEEYGTVFVYRVFNNVSYGLIMRVSEATEIGDIVRSPE